MRVTLGAEHKEGWREGVIVAAIAVIGVWMMPPLYAGASVLVAAMALLAFVVPAPALFLALSAATVVLARPSVLFWGEMLSVLAVGIVLFLCARFIIFARTLFTLWLFVALGDVMVWTIQTGGGWLFSPVFYTELLYTVLFSSMIFFVLLWQKRIFS